MNDQTNTSNPSSYQRVEIPADVRSFLDGILKDANMSILDEETHEDMLQELYQRLDNFLASIVVQNLPPEHLEQFIKMNEEKKSREEVQQFLQEKVPNIQEVFARAFMEFRDLYLGNVAVQRNAPGDNNPPGGAKNPQDSDKSPN